MNNMFLDHTKKYMMIDGHQIELSFAPEPNNDLFARVSSILINSHICNKASYSVKSNQKEVKSDG